MGELLLPPGAREAPAPPPTGRTTVIMLTLTDDEGSRVSPPVVTRPHPYFHDKLGQYLQGAWDLLAEAGWSAELVRVGI